MVVYAVMCDLNLDHFDAPEIYGLYTQLEDAEAIVKASMSGNRSSYSPMYWVDAMEVNTGD
jgi:hypothetical protein